MADKTAIEWTDATWNPITGCSVVSPGCTNCYAMRLAGTRLRNHPSRAGLTIDSKAGPVWNGELRFNKSALRQPLSWKQPRRIFVCAHGDLFHESVPDEWIDQIFAVMALAPQHTFQVLTKRADRMRAYFTALPARAGDVARWGTWHWGANDPDSLFDQIIDTVQHALPNVWLGVSVEDQKRADERIPDLLATPAAIRWISAEPLLGPLDLRRIRYDQNKVSYCVDALNNLGFRSATWWREPDVEPVDQPRRTIDWVVAGGESGSSARPMHPVWVRSIRDQCAEANVPFLFKQWGEWAAVSQMSEDQIEGCYPPRSERHPEATRQSLVETHVLHGDGSRHGIVDRNAFLHGTEPMKMFKLGKKRAGRELDGDIYDAFPALREVPAL
ncbi:phage Gp37/Gp68 family protein [Georhizobium profundi]|uniref:Phage Gp37/Gp68 family protein n=1 Tax=Georhizobium profundi TaxID=2341112 RepID=A0A3S9B4Z3_9HYPH|nr:phage Gp37/Gp68 family protein [Georhizobium profundi]AZN71983.1 phage Gp37/Gp68 family protein [Georhizobium profundi]